VDAARAAGATLDGVVIIARTAYGVGMIDVRDARFGRILVEAAGVEKPDCSSERSRTVRGAGMVVVSAGV
jgi:hypothetical protein